MVSSGPVLVTALLGPDNAGDAITDVVASAIRDLDVAVYEMGPGYAGELATAARRARVRLLLDAHVGDGANPASVTRLGGTAVAVRQLGSRGAEAHWKLIIAGQDTLLVGSGNLISRDAPRHSAAPDTPLAGTREWWLELREAPAFATQARRALEAAWVRAGSEPPQFPVVVPARLPPPAVGVPFPQVPPFTREVALERIRLATDAAGCAALLGTELAAARRRLLVTIPYVHARAAAVRAPLAQLCDQAEAGIDVRLLLGAVPSDGISATRRELRGLGIAVRVMDPQRATTGHAKGLVADGAVMVGSSNWSQGGLAENLEAALVVDDAAVADHYAAAFERDWEASQ